MTEQTTETTATEDAGNLQLNDIENATRIIEVASRRGAFQANELAQVGLVYNRLTAFVKLHKPEEVPAETAEQTEPEAAPAPVAPTSGKRKSKKD